MSLQNCPECGKLFLKRFYDICDECKSKEDDQFNEVCKFLKKEPLSKIEKIEKETGVPRKKILKFLREGRLKGIEVEEKEELKCISCGKPIPGGKLCEGCAKEFQKKVEELEKPAKKEEIKEKERKEKIEGEVYILDRIKKKREEK